MTAVILALFGLVTLAASGSVLFNLGGAREMAGATVAIVLWMNFLAGFLYLFSAIGLFRLRPWAPLPLLIAFLLLLVAAIGFLVHVQQGSAYEQRTIGALAFRMFATLLLFVAARYFIRPFRQET